MKYELDSIDESTVSLDTFNSDLNLVLDASKYSAHPLTKEGFAFMWAGARATHGTAKGKVCFEVKIIEHLDVSHLPSDEPNPHVVRVGFSVNSSTLQLGEDPLSYGFGGTGKISTNCQFKDFGPSFIAGDCILAVANLESDLVQIGFSKNGNFLGWAYKIKKCELEGKALFPHVLSKNCSFEVNFGQKEEPYFKLPDPVKDYTFVGCLPMDQRVGGARPPEKREDCEMIMMCGLPGSGKSVWAADYSLKNPDKKYNVLGTNNIIDKMKVMGLPRKRNYAGRWDVLIQMATKSLNTMFAIGSKLRRNYILDQTNVYPTAQRRKMKNFEGFKRIAVVVVPTEEEYKRRCDKRDREEGKEIPDSAVLEMKANFKLPDVNDIFDDVIFTELQREEAEKLVKQYNEEGKAAIGPARKHFRPNEPLKDKGFDSRKGNFNFSTDDTRDDYRSFTDNQDMRGPNAYGGNRNDYGNFNNRGRFNGRRGSRGGYDSGFGGRGNNARGGYHGPGSYVDSYGGSRDCYDGNYTGGYEDSQGGYIGAHGGDRGTYDLSYEGDRPSYDGGFMGARGSYDGNRGNGRGSYDGNGRGGYDGNRGNGRGNYDTVHGRGRGFDGSRRGGYDGSRGNGRGSYDSCGGVRSDYDCRDRYDNRRGAYNAYGTAGRENIGNNYNSGYIGDTSYNKSNRFEQGGETFRGDYNTSENIPNSSQKGSFTDGGEENYATEKFSDQGYRNNSSNEYKRGASNNRFQSGNRGAASRGGSRGSFNSDMYSKDRDYSSGYNTGNVSGTEGSYSRDYCYDSGYGDHKAQSSTGSYSARNIQSSYATGINAKNNNPQRFTEPSLDTENKYTQGTGYSGTETRTRWSSDPPQTISSVNTCSAGRSQSYNFPKADLSAMSSQAKQTYGYQQGVTVDTAEPWMPSSASSNPTSYGSAQCQWMQYGQQLPNQYYSQ